MDILCVIVFGLAGVGTAIPFLNKKCFSTFPIFFGVFFNACLFLVCYIWFLNNILNL